MRRSAKVCRAGDGWRVYLYEHGTKRKRSLGQHATREAALAHLATVDPETEWREEHGTPGPPRVGVGWTVAVHRPIAGRSRWYVKIERREGGRRQSICAGRSKTATEAEAIAARIRLDPAAHWREPRRESKRARESKRRAALRRAQVRTLPTRAPELLPSGWWLLPCGLHESKRLHLHCATCDRAEALNAAARDELARSWSQAGKQRAARARWEAA